MKSREIVLNRTGVASLVGAVVAALALVGVHVTDTFSEQVVNVLVVVLPIVLPLLAGLWARKDVTPVADPVDADGIPLVPVGGTVSPRQDTFGDASPIDDSIADGQDPLPGT